MTKPSKEELTEALRLSTVQLQDLWNGWRACDLCEPPDVTLKRSRELLHRMGVDADNAPFAPVYTAAQRKGD